MLPNKVTINLEYRCDCGYPNYIQFDEAYTPGFIILCGSCRRRLTIDTPPMDWETFIRDNFTKKIRINQPGEGRQCKQSAPISQEKNAPLNHFTKAREILSGMGFSYSEIDKIVDLIPKDELLTVDSPQDFVRLILCYAPLD